MSTKADRLAFMTDHGMIQSVTASGGVLTQPPTVAITTTTDQYTARPAVSVSGISQGISGQSVSDSLPPQQEAPTSAPAPSLYDQLTSGWTPYIIVAVVGGGAILYASTMQ